MTNVVIDKDYGKKIVFSTLIVDMVKEKMSSSNRHLEKLRNELMNMSVNELWRIYNTYVNYGVTSFVFM